MLLFLPPHLFSDHQLLVKSLMVKLLLRLSFSFFSNWTEEEEEEEEEGAFGKSGSSSFPSLSFYRDVLNCFPPPPLSSS